MTWSARRSDGSTSLLDGCGNPKGSRSRSPVGDIQGGRRHRRDFSFVVEPATRPSLLLWQLGWSEEKRPKAAARRFGERPMGQRVSPAVAGMVGWRRDRTASMISDASMPCTYVESAEVDTASASVKAGRNL